VCQYEELVAKARPLWSPGQRKLANDLHGSTRCKSDVSQPGRMNTMDHESSAGFTGCR
jgi:hypothetical protein